MARTDVEALLARQHGAVAVSQVPGSRGALAGMVGAGRLVRFLPGVYVVASLAASVPTRAQAALLWRPGSVVTGGAAAALTFWPERRVEQVELLTASWRSPVPGVKAGSTVVPGEGRCVVGGLDVTTPEWTAVWMARWDDGEAIEQALRRGWMTVAGMQDAAGLMRGTRGNKVRASVVERSVMQPWSAAERRLHVILREAGISGWRGNWPVTLGGTTWPVDVAFPRLKVAIEVDGFAFHADRATFDWDREKHARLVEADWVVLRFTWTMLVDDPEGVLRRIRTVLERQRQRLPWGMLAKRGHDTFKTAVDERPANNSHSRGGGCPPARHR